ncbi:SulP family inorganic anion transporter [Pseudomonas sp. SIMBA_041]|uniref:SulP family inorganic anion transporter n=2 Tax=Pseudomonas TaxID=286 RepID=UPI0007219D1B|nr:SulP family inorganic anion transporter [Pseudomonas sp. URMO17WK12:I11]CRL52205.1 C4-dicarboxylic acid transporter DauA [Pseudomonas sp. URMO17WK12:I11]
MIAIAEAWKAGLLGRGHWLRNLVSGVIVGVVALPLAMAFAIASGVKPEQGIYTAIVGGLLVSLFGGSSLQIAGPTGAFIVILAGVTAKHGVDGLQIATMMAGAMLLLLGMARLGSVIKFIPDPVIVGFTAGIGVIIWVGQWRDFFGLPAVSGEHFHDKFWHLLQALPDLHVATTLLAVISLFLVITASKIPGLKRVPGPLIAMAVATAIQSIVHFEGVATIGSAFGGIPQGLPALSLPEVTMSRVIDLIGPAFAIAMLGAIESLLSAVVADGMAGTKHDSNQELIGQGVANLVSPLFGGFAATGAIARTATNIRNGGTSPLAGVMHAVTLVLIILFLAPLASNIPLCALAAILFVVAYNMSELKHFKRMVQRAPRADVAILLITFSLTVFSDLVIAVNIGVILAMLHFMRRMASSVEVQQVVEHELEHELRANGHVRLPPGTLIYTIEGPLFFGAAETFERVLAQTHTDPRLLIIRLKRVPFMDITGLQVLEEVIQQLHKRNIVVKLCEANAKVLNKLDRVGILQEIGMEHYHADFNTALDKAFTLAEGKSVL